MPSADRGEYQRRCGWIYNECDNGDSPLGHENPGKRDNGDCPRCHTCQEKMEV